MARKKDSPQKAALRELMGNYLKENNVKVKDGTDVNSIMRDMMSIILEGALDQELDEELGYSKYDYRNKETDNSRNGYSQKTLHTSYGDMEIDIPRDRKGDFEPQVVKKYQNSITQDMEEKIISMYAKGMTTADIESHMRELYDLEISDSTVSRITDKILPIVKEWQERPLESVYAVVFMDAIHFHARNEGRIVKRAVYIAIGIDMEGRKDVLGMYVGQNESAKFWLSILNGLKTGDGRRYIDFVCGWTNWFVYYYPLIDGVGNFLKRPVVKIADIADSSLIIEKGVREFLDTYKDTVYADGLTAKLGIYCGTIEKLEETVYPQVSRIVAEYGLGTDVILKFHKGNKQYKMSADSQMQFDILDKSISKIRIVLLVQIGKEGWDCRSLTGIILSQEGDCPTKMVLQTSCRCLRQVIKNGQETALIYLNESNAEKLNMQLERQHHISLKEFLLQTTVRLGNYYQAKVNHDMYGGGI